MTSIKEFVSENFKAMAMILSFVVTMYVQHVNNTTQIVELKNKCSTLELKINDQYERIDAIKLDKAVFEANMVQLSSMRNDIGEMRSDIKELLKNKK